MRKRTALGDPLTHYWLALKMANLTGVDMWEARKDGHITPEEFSGVLKRCRGCDWEHDGLCEIWMKNREHSSLHEAPERCQNGKVFQTILERIEAAKAPEEDDFWTRSEGDA